MKLLCVIILNVCLLIGEPTVANPTSEKCCDKISAYSLESSCPEGWERYKNEKYFKLFRDTPMNWTEAKNECEKEKSTLASVHSYVELQFLRSYYLREHLADETFDSTWIGGFRKGIFWNWLDLSRVDFYTWALYYPDAHPNHNCIYLATNYTNIENKDRYGKMSNELPCDYKFTFICQK